MADKPQPLTPADLMFAAEARCRHCKAGLAYPHKGTTPASAWICSAVLLGEVPHDDRHTAAPFVFYEIKSERQPSANGATTRRPDQRLPGA